MGGLPARAYPSPLSLRKDQVAHGTIDHEMTGLPTSVAPINDGLTGVAVVDENSLFSIPGRKIAEVLTRAKSSMCGGGPEEAEW
jgi:hypothetical protein